MSVISTVVPPYAGSSASVYGRYGQESGSRGALIATSRSERGTVIEEPVIEHEHHHLHHHIDHGSVSSVVSRRNREYNYHERSSASSVGSIGERRHRHRHRHRGSDGVTRYTHSEVEISEYEGGSRSRRRSIDDDAKSDWTMIDVPPGTRRITLETDEGGFNIGGSARGSSSDLSRQSRVPARGVRRSRGTSTELWTECTKDLVTREAIEEMGYPYEETEFYFYIFEYLEKDQVRELIDLTADIRHERVRELEYKRRLQMCDDRDRRSNYDYDDGSERVTREVIHDHVTEVSYADDYDRPRRRGRYYH